MNIFAKRVGKLREAMQEKGLDAYLVVSADPHLSEYLSDYYKVKDYLSGFQGSVGTLVFTQKEAYLWVDGRYWLQAQKQLEGSGVVLQKQDKENTFQNWLKKNLKQGQILGSDFAVLNLALKKELEGFCTLKHCDLIALMWSDRPSLPKAQIYAHEKAYCALSAKEKIALVRQKMCELGAENHLISSLDDIAYLTNLRGADVEYNPVFLSHLLIKQNETLLFVDEGKISGALKEELESEGILIYAYESVIEELKRLENTTLLIESAKMTALLVEALNSSVKLIEEINPSTHLKAVKGAREISHIEDAMIEDGVALCRFFAWLEEALEQKQKINEVDIDTRITEFRAKSPFYISNSFATIAAFKGNGAFPHYKAEKQNCLDIEGDGFLLIDSGGQYKNGTTDITRVVPVGVLCEEQIHDYTLVLKAHIAISRAIFPKNIAMPLLDAITRQPLWEEQLDYIHGTGHGVGYFLNVHEGPQVLSYFAPVLEKTRAKEGMLSSIEPGIYKAGKWGVRLENLVVNTKVENPKNSAYGEFLYFKPVTLCPFELSCIDVNLLDEKEKRWLNAYHQKVRDKLSPRLKDEPKALKWLEARVRAI
ncbi:aminopeptidase P family protein [Campylobacter upsaliensis]|uniref:Aminopeptidase P family protein n=1 Tax=Campylobacter upsaliensis TaxID=28080 RepID=A0A5L8U1V8_CAMUP|nr:aminopeptidase P family protein [Campylobacter upsaliensis]EAH5879814.1 aminopeptidase P family protein [Campylobacter upsaliensis]EAH8208610.1 aminopeptidase P family protein [Campylobacter upsaliensis]EAH9380873.1 aminopeptidase P family protein [Campylobacter upsaliensis]EAH9987976.1 aminopeptidase P family protein [Campylobacter upsaliensis]EAI0687472.1 aminopeptidase P family protein [Campylobacter upsaliensis]